MRRATFSRREIGASAIEFAIVFPLFFGLIFIMVSYGLLFSLQHSITETAKESARAAVACDPTLATTEHETCVTNRVRATAAAALDWLPADLRNRILGASNGNVEVTFETGAVGKTVEVLVQTTPRIPSSRRSRETAVTSKLTPVLTALDDPLTNLFNALGITLGGADIRIVWVGTNQSRDPLGVPSLAR